MTTGSYHGAWPPELTTCPFELTCPKCAESICCPFIPAPQGESSEHAHSKAMVLNMIKHRTILYAILNDFARQLSMPVTILCGRVFCRAFSLSCKAIVDTQFKLFNQNPFKAFFKLLRRQGFPGLKVESGRTDVPQSNMAIGSYLDFSAKTKLPGNDCAQLH